MKWVWCTYGTLACAGAAAAFEPTFDISSQVLIDEVHTQSVLSVPTGAFDDGAVPADTISGNLRKRSWRFPSGFGGTAALSAEMAAQLLDQGYDLLLSCDAVSCGGFDFRFSVDVMLPPHMFVDLSDFFFLSGRRDTAKGSEGVTVLISRSVQSGLLQVFTVSPETVTGASPTVVEQRPLGATGTAPHDGAEPADVSAGAPSDTSDALSLRLARDGHVALEDLTFETGASKLAEGSFQSLQTLAEYLNQDASRRIALVGHTDSQGSLDANINLSRKRAASVKARLVTEYSVKPAQVEAQGAGYLAPIASNLTEEGRRMNRRVEAVLLRDESQ